MFTSFGEGVSVVWAVVKPVFEDIDEEVGPWDRWGFGAILTSVFVVRSRTLFLDWEPRLTNETKTAINYELCKVAGDPPTLRRTRVRPKTQTSISWPILATRTCERSVDSTWDACISCNESLKSRNSEAIIGKRTIISQSSEDRGSVATDWAEGKSCSNPISTLKYTEDSWIGWNLEFATYHVTQSKTQALRILRVNFDGFKSSFPRIRRVKMS